MAYEFGSFATCSATNVAWMDESLDVVIRDKAFQILKKFL
jgi:hypothetical protein